MAIPTLIISMKNTGRMGRVFADTDVVLDLLAQREPFYDAAARLFTRADNGTLTICVSALSFSNLNYLLSRRYDARESRRILDKFKVLVKVLAVNEKTIELALNSKFTDFEDAIQYYTATQNNIRTLLTRNIRDYKHAAIKVFTPETYLKL